MIKQKAKIVQFQQKKITFIRSLEFSYKQLKNKKIITEKKHQMIEYPLDQPLMDNAMESERIPTTYSETDSFYGVVNVPGKDGSPKINPRGYIYEVYESTIQEAIEETKKGEGARIIIEGIEENQKMELEGYRIEGSSTNKVKKQRTNKCWNFNNNKTKVVSRLQPAAFNSEFEKKIEAQKQSCIGMLEEILPLPEEIQEFRKQFEGDDLKWEKGYDEQTETMEEYRQRSNEHQKKQMYQRGLTHHTEIYANPFASSSTQTAYIFLHGCNVTEQKLILRIYRLTQHLEPPETKFELIYKDLVLNNSSPYRAWHSQMTLTEKGIVFFQIHQENQDATMSNQSQILCKVQIFDFDTEQIKTLRCFKFEGIGCRGLYLCKSMSGRVLDFKSVESFLEQNYVVDQSSKGLGFFLKIRKLSEPTKVFVLQNQALDNEKQPMVFRIQKDDPDSFSNQDNTILMVTGDEFSKYKMILFETQGNVKQLKQVNSDDICDHFRSLTSDMDKVINSEYHDYFKKRTFVCALNEEQTISKIAETLAGLDVLESQKYFFERCLQQAQGQTAALFSKDNVTIVGKSNLLQIQIKKLEVGYQTSSQFNLAQDVADHSSDHVYISSEIKNIAVICQMDEFSCKLMFIEKEMDIEIEKQSFEDGEKQVLKKRFFQNALIPHYLSVLPEKQMACSSGGFFLKNKDDWSDFKCLVYSNEWQHSDFDGTKKIIFGGMDKEQEGLLVELLRVNYSLVNESSFSPPVALLAVQTKPGHLCGGDDEIEEAEKVNKIEMVITQTDQGGKLSVLAHHAIPLFRNYQVSRYQIQRCNGDGHYNWSWCQISGIHKVELESKWYDLVDYAFCELGHANKKILITHVYRYIHNQDFTYNQIYQVGLKCLIGRQKDEMDIIKQDSIRIVPLFDYYNQIKGGKIVINGVSYPFLNNHNKNPAFSDNLTESWLEINKNGPFTVDSIQVEVQLSRETMENVSALSQHQIWKILADKLSSALDTVPNDVDAFRNIQKCSEIRQFSNYQFLKGMKPYQQQDLTPNELDSMIEQEEDANIEESQKTLIDIVMPPQDQRREYLSEMGLYENNPILKRNEDFSTMIEHYISEQNYKLVYVFSQRIQKVYETKIDKAYGIMMCVLHKMSSQPNLVPIFDWFLKQAKISEFEEQGTKLNIQIRFKSKNLIELSRYEQSQFLIDSIPVATIEQLVYNAETLLWDISNDQQTNGTIEQALIDQRLPGIYKFVKQLQNEQKVEDQAQVSNYDMSKLVHNTIHSMPNLIDEFKVLTQWIDLNFEQARWFHIKLFIAFIVMFWIPLIYLLFFDSEFQSTFIACSICLTQILGFTAHEFVQLSYTTLDGYLQEPQNKQDALFIISCLCYFIGRIHLQEKVLEILGDKILTYSNIVIIILAILKFFYLFRIFQTQGKITMLLKKCMKDTIPFLIFLLAWVNFFALLSMVMGIQFDGTDYDGVSNYFVLLITFLRISVGDVQAPQLRSCKDQDLAQCQSMLLTMMWLQFVFEIYFLNIILLNFVIALISSSHENFMTQSKLLMYQNKIDLILEYYQLRDFMDWCNMQKLQSFNTIVMFLKVDESQVEAWEGSVNCVRNHINFLCDKIIGKVDSNAMSTNIKIEMVETSVKEEFSSQIQEVKVAQESVNQKVDQVNQLVKDQVEKAQNQINEKVDQVRDEVKNQFDQIMLLLQNQQRQQQPEQK